MSSTRHAAEGSPLHQNRYMSDPAYVETRGINGAAVAAKATLYVTHLKRNLLYYLQSRSLSDGGLKKMATEIVEMFPERIGSPTMHKHGIKAGRLYPIEVAREINSELGLDHGGGVELSELNELTPWTEEELAERRGRRALLRNERGR